MNTTTDSITIRLPIPHKRLWPNARGHWAAKAKATKIARRRACFETMALLKGKKPRWKSAREHLLIVFPDKRRRDPLNIAAACKAYRDGIVDAGLLADDDKLLGGSVDVLHDKTQEPHVTITITRED